MKLFAVLSAVVALASVASCSSFFSLPSPWVWVCRDSRCFKEPRSADSSQGGQSLAACKLTCNGLSMLWPKPRGSFTAKRSVVTFHIDDLHFSPVTSPTSQTESLLNEAIQITTSHLRKASQGCDSGASNSKKRRHTVDVNVAIDSDEDALSMTTDESYNLEINTTTSSTSTVVEIKAKTFFGARHALETLSQLITWDDSISKWLIVSDVSISDSPAYVHRGLLIDTSRNYVSVEMIKKILDAMSFNKLNVFHWHLTDTHSFPFVSRREPLLALYGAYSASKVYRPEDVEGIVHYAMVRGIKVLPEFDAPAHVGEGWQWGDKYGLGQLALCVNKEPWTQYCVEPPCGQLNPVNDNIYPILGNIYKDMSELFRSDVFHMGGDEVKMDCWNETEEIVDWLKLRGMSNDKEGFLDLWSYFQNKSLTRLDEAYGNQQPVILWTSGLTEEGHTDKYLDPKRYIIQIWTNETDPSIAELYTKGYKLIMSNFDAWYLDCGYGAWVGDGLNNWCSPYIGWQKVYQNSPRRIITNFNLTYNEEQVLGGEAALWSEQVDGVSMEGKLWPRGSAFAERMWSDPDTDWKAAEYRMIHHRQRLVERGVMADALQPEWCHQNEGYCFL